MSSALKPWTLERFLEREERQELRYEFDGLRPIAMTGGTQGHDLIQVNIVAALHARLRGKPWRVHGSNIKIEVMGSIRYPDAFVTCAQLVPSSTIAAEPVAIFEVLDESTAHHELTTKRREYAGTASVGLYVTLEQTRIEGIIHTRTLNGRGWLGHLLDADTILDMPDIGVEVPFAEFYVGLDLAGVAKTQED